MISPNAILFGTAIWGVGTTILGLYLSWKNTMKQNQKIIELLESISRNTEGKNGNN